MEEFLNNVFMNILSHVIYSLIKQWILLVNDLTAASTERLTFHFCRSSVSHAPYSYNKSDVTFYKKDISCLEMSRWNIGGKYINILLCNNVTCKQNSDKYFFTSTVSIIASSPRTIQHVLRSCLVYVTWMFCLCFCREALAKCNA